MNLLPELAAAVPKVLFVHNGPLLRDQNDAFYGVHYTEQIKQRYLQLGDHVTFLMRQELIEAPNGRFSRIEPAHFDFVAVPDLMSPWKRLRNHHAATRVIRHAVDDADIVIARIPSLIARLAVGYAHRSGKPFLIECVACNWDALWNHGWMGKLSAPWYALMQRRVMRRASHAIYVTEEFLQRRYPTTGRSIGISDVQLPEPKPERLYQRLARIRARGDWQSALRLVTVADVAVKYKGQGDLFPALIEMKAAGIDIEYHLVGGGDPSRLKALALNLGVEDQIVFHGVLKHHEVFELLEQMDVYVQPSHQEGLPRAVVEAMSLGMPVIGAATGGIPELLPKSRVFRAGHSHEFRAVLERLLPIPEQTADARRNFARAGDFQASVLAAKRRAFYRDFLTSNGLPTGALAEASV